MVQSLSVAPPRLQLRRTREKWPRAPVQGQVWWNEAQRDGGRPSQLARPFRREQSVQPGLALFLSGIAVLSAVGLGPLAKQHPPNKFWLSAIEDWLFGFVSGYLIFFVAALAFSVFYFAIFQ